jgi:hypothetical protein
MDLLRAFQLIMLLVGTLTNLKPEWFLLIIFHNCTVLIMGIRNSVVGIATCLRAGRPRGRSSSPSRVKNFLFFTSSRPGLGSPQPPIQWVSGVLSTGVKRPWREADHSPRASAEIKNM